MFRIATTGTPAIKFETFPAKQSNFPLACYTGAYHQIYFEFIKALNTIGTCGGIRICLLNWKFRKIGYFKIEFHVCIAAGISLNCKVLKQHMHYNFLSIYWVF